MSWAFSFPIGFVALYTQGDGERRRKYTLPVVGAVRALGDFQGGAADRDPRWGTILVPAPAASPDVGDVVPAISAMSFEEGWTFQGIGYAEQVSEPDEGEANPMVTWYPAFGN